MSRRSQIKLSAAFPFKNNRMHGYDGLGERNLCTRLRPRTRARRKPSAIQADKQTTPPHTEVKQEIKTAGGEVQGANASSGTATTKHALQLSVCTCN